MEPHIFIQLRVPFHHLEGDQAICDCPFCGKEKHLFVRVDESSSDYFWDCKVCSKMGNLQMFFELFWRMLKDKNEENGIDAYLSALSKDRNIKVKTLLRAGFVWDKDRWLLPVRDERGNIATFRLYTPGVPSKALKQCKTKLFNAHLLEKRDSKAEIYLCEGEWDALKLQEYLDENEINAIALGTPGATVFKANWASLFVNRPVNVVYDHDESGRLGMQKVCLALKGVSRFTRYIAWPPELPDGFDVRDFLGRNGTLDLLEEMLHVWKGSVDDRKKDETDSTKKLDYGQRKSFDELVEIFSKHLCMTKDMNQVLKVALATVYTNQIPGDPLWVHVVGPPGSGKTLLLMSLADCPDVHAVSTLTPHALISGFALPGGADPSLVPKLLGKTLIVKDFTEVVQMLKPAKEEVYAVLRGAYDGHIYRQFGNGTVREYFGYFSMLTGVTSAIYAEQHNSTLGERFLLFAMNKSEITDLDDIILSAISGSGNEAEMKADINAAVKDFLNVELPVSTLDIEKPIRKKIVFLAQFVAQLRAQVAKNEYKQTLLYRPQHEVGTRLAKQFMKLAAGLYFVNGGKFTDDDWLILQKIAIDTCIGFNLEIVSFLIHEEEGATADVVCEALSLPSTTAREALGDLTTLNILEKEIISNGVGRPKHVYHVSDEIKNLWDRAGLNDAKSFIYRTKRRTRRAKAAVSEE